MKQYLFCLLLIFFSSCARRPIKNVEESMRLSSEPPELVDSLSRDSFFSTLNAHINVMKKSRIVKDPMVFGPMKISKSEYIKSLEEIFNHENDWLEWIKTNFDFYEVYGREEWGEALSTGYYEPIVRGSLKKSDEFTQAVYSAPSDLVTVNLKAFSYKFTKGLEHTSLRGRLNGDVVIPYYTRAEIDGENKLANKKLEIAWMKPIDSFFIQIQGSGVIELEEGGSMRIGYADQNGHPYVAVGKSLANVIPIEEMSMQRIRSHLETLTRDEQQKVLNTNPSYVFFRKLDSLALTYAGMEVSAGRTIATDKNIFPKGALAFLQIEEPSFETLSSTTPIAWLNRPRLVFDQDTGGAITGGGRLDLYYGQGDEAAQKAGVMKRVGKLFYLVPKNLAKK